MDRTEIVSGESAEPPPEKPYRKEAEEIERAFPAQSSLNGLILFNVA